MLEPNPVEVLLVEDNYADVLLVEEALEECPVPTHLTTVSDGEEALQLLMQRTYKVDLIILDLHLPKLNGLELLERYQPRAAPVILFSSNCSSPDAERALKLGASGCIIKPSDLKAFVDAICAMLTRWAAPVPVA